MGLGILTDHFCATAEAKAATIAVMRIILGSFTKKGEFQW
jgi:hypothetical protein